MSSGLGQICGNAAVRTRAGGVGCTKNFWSIDKEAGARNVSRRAEFTGLPRGERRAAKAGKSALRPSLALRS